VWEGGTDISLPFSVRLLNMFTYIHQARLHLNHKQIHNPQNTKNQALAAWDAVDEHSLGSSQNGLVLRAKDVAALGAGTAEFFFQVGLLMLVVLLFWVLLAD
jgi:hypothetical protein